MAKKRGLRVGVIGAGGRGVIACYVHNPKENVFVTAGADVNPAALAEFRKQYGPESFVTKDYREMLKRDDVDAVLVCSPDFLHEEHAVAALEAGKAVYLEKPMAITIAGCDRILETAFRKKVRLMCGHNMRYLNTIQTMRGLIRKGAIGEVKAGWCRHFVSYGGDAYFHDWHAERRNTTTLLLQKGAHDIDVLHWLCGGYTRCTTAFGNLTVYNQVKDRHPASERGDARFNIKNWPPLSVKGLNPVIDVEDLSMMLMELDNGVLCSYQQCHYTPDAWRNYTIIGTEGRIENMIHATGEIVALWDKRVRTKPYGTRIVRPPKARGGHGGADPNIFRAFVNYVRDGRKVLTSPIAARNSVAAGYMAAQSLRNGGAPMAIPPVRGELVRYFARDVEE